jgi:hypothetical protein
MSRAVHLLCFAILAVSLAACALIARPMLSDPSYATEGEEGLIQRLRPVTQGRSGIVLRRAEKIDLGGLYAGPSDSEEEANMSRAVQAAIGSVSPRSGATGIDRRLGTAYMVRLRCGGLVYAFERGKQKFAVGAAVTVEHGLSPRLVAR